MKPPLGRYFGGKQRLAARLLQLMPPHTTYVEPFCGSAALYFAKQPSKIEVLNDLDDGLVNFYRVLRDPELLDRLLHLLELTPYARSEYFACGNTWRETSEPVERARRWYVYSYMSYSGVQQGSPASSGWSYSVTQSQARNFRNNLDVFKPALQRLRCTLIDNRPAATVIQGYDNPDTLFYCDPPYMLQTRSGGKRYSHEMSFIQHARLLRILQRVQSMVILSGYNNTLYTTMLAGWHKIEVELITSVTPKTRINGKGAIHSEAARRTEVIWLNPACVAAQGMFSLEMCK